jgi:SAM-dependent methyltransferase
MDHTDHVALIRTGVTGAGTTWADIGAGTGAFTLALADLLGDGARIISVDRDRAALAENARLVAERFPFARLTTLVGDLQEPLELPSLDGLLAANSLHFVAKERQAAAVVGLARHLRPGAPFIVVEYDADRGNPWVPHPFSVGRWREIAATAGLVETVEIGRVPSRFLGSIYAAVSRRPPQPDPGRISGGSGGVTFLMDGGDA